MCALKERTARPVNYILVMVIIIIVKDHVGQRFPESRFGKLPTFHQPHLLAQELSVAVWSVCGGGHTAHKA